jgi:hypothetical protein
VAWWGRDTTGDGALTEGEAEHADREPRWPASLAVFASIVLYATLPGKFTLGPPWLFPALEGAILVPLTIAAPHRTISESGPRRIAALVLIAIVNVANMASLALLVRFIERGAHLSGRELIFSAAQIWLTNVLLFGLWYWELDRGGPGRRLHPHGRRPPDFLFAQMVNPDVTGGPWRPAFVDYLYVSFTNATAFSPTDTLPLSRWAKMLMAVQSLAALVTVAVVAARAVNIIS